jgi:hypothetical protein
MTDNMIAQLRTKYCCAAWNADCDCGEIADRIEAQAAEIERLREALDRQSGNMAFAINNAVLPVGWREKFMRELEEDRKALAGKAEQ